MLVLYVCLVVGGIIIFHVWAKQAVKAGIGKSLSPQKYVGSLVPVYKVQYCNVL